MPAHITCLCMQFENAPLEAKHKKLSKFLEWIEIRCLLKRKHIRGTHELRICFALIPFLLVFFHSLLSSRHVCEQTFGTAPAPSVILWHAPAKWLRKMRSHGNYERRRENSSSSPDSSEFHFDPLYRARSLMVLRFVFDKRTTHRNDKEIGCRSKCSANERREDKNRTTNTVSACTTHRQHHHNDAVLRCGAHARHGKVYFIPILLFILLRCRKRMFLKVCRRSAAEWMGAARQLLGVDGARYAYVRWSFFSHSLCLSKSFAWHKRCQHSIWKAIIKISDSERNGSARGRWYALKVVNANKKTEKIDTKVVYFIISSR